MISFTAQAFSEQYIFGESLRINACSVLSYSSSKEEKSFYAFRPTHTHAAVHGTSKVQIKSARLASRKGQTSLVEISTRVALMLLSSFNAHASLPTARFLHRADKCDVLVLLAQPHALSTSSRSVSEDRPRDLFLSLSILDVNLSYVAALLLVL